MDKTILKKFAIESRQDLMQKVESKIKLFYIDETFSKQQNGDVYVLSNEKHSLSLSKEEFDKRELLIKRINELGLEQVIEEAAYTWFNRIVAIRYMEINDYLPLTKDNQSLGIRVLSSKDNTPDPEIMKFTNLVNPDLDIDFRKERYAELKDDNEKFKYILLLVCKKLGKVIPQVFDGITDYIDILIPDNLLNDTGFIAKIVNEVPTDNYNQVEIIGWLYQYYNQLEKDRVMSSKGYYKKNEIPYATQIFTPDWIVKYMVENSLGRFWIENCEQQSEFKDELKYLIKENIIQKNKQLNPINIKFIDPCCGSGHILIYAFELLFKIYLNAGFNKNDISNLILQHNLYGLDIDDRAGQLSVLSVILKAREYDKNIFNKEIISKMNIMSIQESNNINTILLDEINDEELKHQAQYLIESFYNAKEYGSLIKLENVNYDLLKKNINENNTIFGIELRNKILPLVEIAKILTTKFDVVVTNPPYMGTNKMSNILKDYLKMNYSDSKTDLCTAFMEIGLVKEDGFLAMINQQAWMFLGSFESLRRKINDNKSINTMIHLGMGTFGADFGTTAFVLEKRNEKENIFYRLVNYKTSEEKEKAFLNSLKNKNNMYYASNKKFDIISGCRFAYWISERLTSAFKELKLSDIAKTKQGLATGNNDLFLRYWFEVNSNNVDFQCDSTTSNFNSKCRWFPCNKGGEFRKWFGNNYRIVDWEFNGKRLKDFDGSVLRNVDYYFKSGLTWSSMTSSALSMRYSPKGFIFESKGSMCFLNDNQLEKYILGLLNSVIINELLLILSPTLDYHEGPMGEVPIIIDQEKITMVNRLVAENITIAKDNWDSFEMSWDFKKHPLITNIIDADNQGLYLEASFDSWKDLCEERFNKLKVNEEQLNEIFIDIYGLKDELSSKIEEKDITVNKANKIRDIKSLISYAVGCMFGRYSLDEDGLVYAGGNFDESKYKTFKTDNDNIIPITDEAYFADDIVSRFKNFIEVVYGKETLNENIDYIAETLGKRGTETSEEAIRRYFLNDFYADHIKIYQKKPIYWLFDSGKKNGFKALIYMHRYNDNTIPKVRLDYLHRIQTTYDKLLTDINYKLTTELSMTDKKQAQNRQADLNAKLQEIKEYDEKIAHIANQRISIDLDDGVTTNYSKFADILAKIK